MTTVRGRSGWSPARPASHDPIAHWVWRVPQPELIDVIAHVTLAELDEIVARGELMLPSVQTMVMGLAYLRKRGLVST